MIQKHIFEVADPLIMMPVINEADENDKLVADTDQISEEDGMATTAVMDDGVDGWEQNWLIWIETTLIKAFLDFIL